MQVVSQEFGWSLIPETIYNTRWFLSSAIQISAKRPTVLLGLCVYVCPSGPSRHVAQ
jgi:ABC-type tungstate transport system substrate-binding protein